MLSRVSWWITCFKRFALGYYIFIETSRRTPGDNARLLSPGLSPSTKCMTFYYHMFGATVSTLTVEAGGIILLKLSGNQGDAWYKATIPLEFSHLFKVTYCVCFSFLSCFYLIVGVVLRWGIVTKSILASFFFYGSFVLKLYTCTFLSVGSYYNTAV